MLTQRRRGAEVGLRIIRGGSSATIPTSERCRSVVNKKKVPSITAKHQPREDGGRTSLRLRASAIDSVFRKGTA